MKSMKRSTLLLRRGFAHEALSSSSSVNVGRKSADMTGRSYLLPTWTVTRDGENGMSNLIPGRRNGSATPIVLDMLHVSSDGSPHAIPLKKNELRAEIDKLQAAGFLPVGITNASDDIKRMALSLHLPSFIHTRAQASDDTQTLEQYSAAPSETIQEQSESARAEPPLVLSTSVRSGQQIFAQNRSLVVLGNVSSGAEVMADGDIVVLGALKGRALAGLRGDASARVFCQKFDGELVSIAHHFTTCETEMDGTKVDDDELVRNKPTEIALQNEQLVFRSTKDA